MKKIKLVLVVGFLFLTTLIFTSCCITHEYESQTVHVPTCTESGYTLFTCKKCGSSYNDDFVKPIGHSNVITKKGSPATCTESGTCDELTCKICNKVTQTINEIKATGHTSFVTKEKVEASCTESGLTEELTCSACGLLIKSQTIIEAFGHSDNDINSLCDKCGTPCGENIIPISSIEDLKNINNDLAGIYQLTDNISLSGLDWIPIGNSSAPFTGYLLGNGYCISGLNLNDKQVGGLFSYNYGTIDSLIVKDFSFSSCNVDSVAGCIAAYNHGTIVNCSIVGTFNINNEASYGYESNRSVGSKSHSSIIGGICGENEGKIEKCKISSVINCDLKNTSIYKFNKPVIWIPNGEYLKVTLNFFFGGITGVNHQIVDECVVESKATNKLSMTADKRSEYGETYADCNIYIGSIIGNNEGEVSNCRGIKFSVMQNSNEISGGVCTANMYDDNMYSGLIAKNSGTVNLVLYL